MMRYFLVNPGHVYLEVGSDIEETTEVPRKGDCVWNTRKNLSSAWGARIPREPGKRFLFPHLLPESPDYVRVGSRTISRLDECIASDKTHFDQEMLVYETR